MRIHEIASKVGTDPEVHAQLRRWAIHDQEQRNNRWIPWLKDHADELGKDSSKQNVMRLWYGTDKVDATKYFDPMNDLRWHGAAKQFIRDNINVILRDPGGWVSQRDAHDVALAHIIVQHMDEDPGFQAWFLDKMIDDPAVARANANEIRFLSDRVEVNRSGYWDNPDSGKISKTIPRGTNGTQGNRFSLDHVNKSDVDA